jgi:predicted ATPase/class 3 adenylate cyclase
MANLPTGTVTLLFTDIEASTRLLDTLCDAYEEVLVAHRRLLRDAFTSHAGTEVDTQGDALFYAFGRATDAVAAAIEAQRALASHPWPKDAPVRVRVGIHTGEPQRSAEGYFGHDVHLAARICSAAHGGQTLLSQATADLIADTALSGATPRDLGAHLLKDIASPVRLFSLAIAGLPAEFPPLRTPSSAHPTNLPARLPPLIGRDDDLATVTELLTRDGVALATLLGPGGTGKTRLAVATGAELLSSFPDGVFFVDLSATTDPSLVVPAIAQTFSLRETPGRSLQDTLIDHLADREILLILDNLEQVIDTAAEIATLLTSASRLKVLATSREPLRITGEKELQLAPLSLPSPLDPPEAVATSPAVELFVTRAQDVRPDFRLTPDDAAVVAEICRRLDGLPLGIELAAARVKVLSLPALKERLEQSLKVLSSGKRDASERQRTLRGAIAWSYDLLSSDEQTLFRRLGVFTGGWSLEAAEQVGDGGDLDTDVLDGLASLVDKSLVRTDEEQERFSMLETIREFASERLEESREAEDSRRRHAEFFRGLAEEAEPHLVGRDPKTWLDRLEQEHANLRTALEWAVTRDERLAIEFAADLSRFWSIRGHLSEGREWLQRVLEPGREEVSRGILKVTSMLAILAYAQGDLNTTQSAAERGISLAQALSDDEGLMRCRETLALCEMDQGRLTQARQHLQQNLERSRALHDERGIAITTGNLSFLSLREGDHEAASTLGRESFERHRRSGNMEGMGASAAALGLNSLLANKFEQAELYLTDSSRIAAEIGHTEVLTSALEGLAAVATHSGDCDRGALLLGAVTRLRDSNGIARDPVEQEIHDRMTKQLQVALTEERLSQLLDQGMVTSIEELLLAVVGGR